MGMPDSLLFLPYPFNTSTRWAATNEGCKKLFPSSPLTFGKIPCRQKSGKISQTMDASPNKRVQKSVLKLHGIPLPVMYISM